MNLHFISHHTHKETPLALVDMKGHQTSVPSITRAKVEKKYHSEHLQRIKNAKKMVDCEAPRQFQHLALRPKKQMLMYETTCRIQRENLILVDKMRLILAKKQMDNISTHLPSQAQRHSRVRRLQDITDENAIMLRRFIEKPSHYDRTVLKKGANEAIERLHRICKYPYVDPIQRRQNDMSKSRPSSKIGGSQRGEKWCSCGLSACNSDNSCCSSSHTRSDSQNSNPSAFYYTTALHQRPKSAHEQRLESIDEAHSRRPATSLGHNVQHHNHFDLKNIGMTLPPHSGHGGGASFASLTPNSHARPAAAGKKRVFVKKLFEGNMIISDKFVNIKVIERTATPFSLEILAYDSQENVSYSVYVSSSQIESMFSCSVMDVSREEKTYMVTNLVNSLSFAPSLDGEAELCVDILSTVILPKHNNAAPAPSPYKKKHDGSH